MKNLIKTKLTAIALTASMAAALIPATAALASAPAPNPNQAIGESLADPATRQSLLDLYDSSTAFLVIHYGQLADDVRISLETNRAHAYQVLMYGGYEAHITCIGDLRCALAVAEASLRGTTPDAAAMPEYVLGSEAYNRTHPLLVSNDIANTVAAVYGNTRNLPPEMVRAELYGYFVDRIYSAALGRTSDQAGREYWVNSIISGERTADDVIITILQSQEFVGRDLSDEAFVTALYKVFFDRTPDSQGLANWVNALNSGVTRAQLVETFTTTQEWSNICAIYGL